jgi:hypothetical protein
MHSKRFDYWSKDPGSGDMLARKALGIFVVSHISKQDQGFLSVTIAFFMSQDLLLKFRKVS